MNTSNEDKTFNANAAATETTIDLTTAQDYVANWLQKFPQVEPASRPANLPPFQAWFIKKEDIFGLSDIVNGPAYSGVRAYLGIDPNYSTENPYNGPMKLLLVPVLSDPQPAGTDQLYSDDGSTSMIYDFTTPCPPMCDTNSLLNVSNIPATKTVNE